MSGGFDAIVGFLFSFIILMFVFMGVFYIFQEQITQQSFLIEKSREDSYISTLKNDFEFYEPYLSSDRLHFTLNNTGTDKLFYKGSGQFCFNIFVNDNFVPVNEYRINILGSPAYDYRFIDIGDVGVLTLNRTLDANQDNIIKLVSCGGVEKTYTISVSEEDWWDNDWELRERFSVDNSYSEGLHEYQIFLDLNSSDLDFEKAKQEEMRFVSPLKDFLLLDLKFDLYGQELIDASAYTNTVFLGSNSSLGVDDPMGIEGVLFGALEFEDDHILVNESDTSLSSEFTFSAWVRWNDTGNNVQRVIYDPNSFTSLSIQNSGVNSSKPFFSVNISDEMKVLYSDSNIDTNWHLLSASYDSDTMKIYLDGELEGELEVGENFNLDLEKMRIGSGEDFEYFVGGIDEVKIFGVSLKDSEHKDLFHNNLRFRELDFYISAWNSGEGNAQIFVKVPYISTLHNTSVHMYYSNEDVSVSSSDMESTFSYTVPRTVGYVVSNKVASSAGLNLMSLYDDNRLEIGSNEYSLDEYDANVLGFASITRGDEVRMKKLSQVEGNAAGTDMVVPASWAGTEFAYTGFSDSQDTFCVLSPWGDASVVIGDNQTGDYTTLNVDSSGSCYENNSIATAGVYVTSDIPVLVSYFGENSDRDSLVFYPATNSELFGVPSRNLRVAAGSDGAQVLIRESDGTLDVMTLGSNQADSDGSNGANGGSDAFKLSPDDLIGAAQQNDGDGSEMSVFAPSKEMGKVFGSNMDVQYVVAASHHLDANCSIYNNGGLVESVEVGTGSSGIYYYGFDTDDTLYQSLPWKLSCEKQVWPYYERDFTDGETNLFGHKQMRQYVYPEPVASIIS